MKTTTATINDLITRISSAIGLISRSKSPIDTNFSISNQGDLFMVCGIADGQIYSRTIDLSGDDAHYKLKICLNEIYAHVPAKAALSNINNLSMVAI